MTARPATGALRRVRDALRHELAALAQRVGGVGAPGDGGQRQRMRGLAADLDACLRPHLEWEERTVHPIVDKFACDGPAAFSACMRYEHVIIHRWMAELSRRAESSDAAAFARRADNLLGLVEAHFELEEQVLFPILDRSLHPESLAAPASR